jgi:hypothetical protein
MVPADIWVQVAMERRWPVTSSPSWNETAAISQCPKMTTRIEATLIKSTTRFRSAGVFSAKDLTLEVRLLMPHMIG